MNAPTTRNPWTWVPSLYFAEGLPYVVVMTVSVIMYKRLGLSNTDIALFTSWLYLPWVIKPLWSPFVDMFRTKRFWVTLTQFILSLTLVSAAFSIPLPNFLAVTLTVFGLMAFSSATHDIAADGFYMLSLDESAQAAYVGVRSTFYRIAMISGQGGLVVLAGTLEPGLGIPLAWSIVFIALAVVFFVLSVYHRLILPSPESDSGSVSGTLSGSQVGALAGGFVAIALVLSGAFFMLMFVFEQTGLPATFATAVSIFALVGGVVILLRTVVGTWIDRSAGRPELTYLGPFIEFLRAFVLFVRKDNIWSILAFLLLFRFAEAQLVKLVSPFLLDPIEKGGLGLSTSDVGVAYGTVGIIALTAGGLLGGYVMSRNGLRWWLWPMVIVMHTPDLAFVYLSQVQPRSFFLISSAVAVEQFGYGFGFTAYMMYMIYISQGAFKTAHYAICTGFMALGMMLPGMFSGALQEYLGYNRFFVWVVLSTIPGFLVAALVRIDSGFGKRKAVME